MNSSNKHFAKIWNSRIIAGKLISNQLPFSKWNNLTEFRYLTLFRDWDKLTNNNYQYSNRRSISPFEPNSSPAPLAANCVDQSGQKHLQNLCLRWWLPRCLMWQWLKAKAWGDLNWQRTLDPGLSFCGDWKMGCLLNVPLLPGPWVWHPWL